MATSTMGARLSVSQTDPTPPGQNTGSTIYYVPHYSTEVTVWNGSIWETLYLLGTESLTLAAGENNRLYDIFVYKNGSGNPQLEKVWWGGAVRGTALVLHEGIWVKDGTTDGKKRRYIGTVFTGGTSQAPIFVDGWDGRWVYNYYNKQYREIKARSPDASWTCPSTSPPGTWRPPNNNPNVGIVGVVVGVADVFLHAHVNCPAEHPDDPAGVYRPQVGIGINSQSARHLPAAFFGRQDTGVPSARSLTGLIAETNEQFDSEGYNYVQWLERVGQVSGPADSATFHGTGFNSTLFGFVNL